ncbi:hypothetical protein AS026_29270 [Rhizobium altiplani]|uniref:Radical SAM core domain-containing protein n=1 Tax=Rhizobium altiplani TaxID=1864509 RepID=A0A120FQW6_9HYPH|nr:MULTISPECIES: radical SAM protein [Rhizobium]KWV59194.1 hypothetical protein AS026_29270 [Rhizobium altiplani]
MSQKLKTLLLFPPFVETNFGCYYPSLPVLASSIEKFGADVLQVDLNAEFLDALLSDSNLSEVGGGRLFNGESVDPTSQICAYARILRRNRSELYTGDGRQRSGAGGLSSMLGVLAEQCRIDVAISSIDSDFLEGSGICRAYRRFFEAWIASFGELDDIDLFAISVPMGPQLIPALVLARCLAASGSSKPVIFGGPSMSLMEEGEKECFLGLAPQESIIVQYDGEPAIGAILRSMTCGYFEPRDIPNASFLEKRRLKVTKLVPGPSLDTLPMPRYSKALLGRLHRPSLAITQARGCYWGKCAYCDFIELYEGSATYRTRRVSNFVDEIEYQVAETGLTDFVLVTESIPPSFARKVSSEILRRDLAVTWTSFAMVDHRFDEDLFRLMKKAGCRNLVIGMESMTDRVLALVQKAGTREKNIAFLHHAKAAGLELTVNIIPDLPTTTYREAIESLEYFRAHEILMGELSLFPFEATKSSQVGRSPDHFGLKLQLSPITSGQAQFASNHIGYADLSMTEAERLDILQKFSRFVSQHNARMKMLLAQEIPAPFANPSGRANCHVDFFKNDDRVVVTNAATGHVASVPQRWLGVLRKAMNLSETESSG